MSSHFHGVQGFNFEAGAVMNQRAARPSTGTVQGKPSLLTDEQILELRALSQFAGWRCDALMARYGVDRAMIDRVVSGVTRSRLVASPRHLPDGVTPR